MEGRAQNVVQLGAREYTLVPQPHAVILRRFPELISGLQDLEGVETSETESFVHLLGDKTHDALRIFIPNLMPKHEFNGYASKKAMEDGEFDEEYAKENTPTFPQILDAFDVGFAVNGGPRLKNILGNVLGPEILRAVRQYAVARMKVGLSQMSANLPSTRDGSEASTSSGTNEETLEVQEELENEESLSPVS